MSRPIDAYALIEKAKDEAMGMEEPFRSSFAVTVAWLVEKMPTIEPEGIKYVELSEEDYEKMAEQMRKNSLILTSAQPERKWIPCSNPPKHHRDVIVRGTEMIGNVTVHKVMQWDVDTWRPTNYAPSIIWEEWSEI